MHSLQQDLSFQLTEHLQGTTEEALSDESVYLKQNRLQ